MFTNTKQFSLVSAGLVQEFHKRFSAVLPMCGGLAGTVALWNSELDSAFAEKMKTNPFNPNHET